MKHPILKISIYLALIVGTVFASLGLLTGAEVVYRIMGGQGPRGLLVDVDLFPYKNFVVSTHKPGLVLGNSSSLLENYFNKDDCRLPDGTSARFNSDGFRSIEFSELGSKEENELRIVIVGGSASISWNVGERCTLDTYLTQELKARFPSKKIIVLNIGSGTWKSFQELISVQLHGLALEPDFVISFSGANDMAQSFWFPPTRAYTTGTMENAFREYEGNLKGSITAFFDRFLILKVVRAWLKPRNIGGTSNPQSKDEAPILAEQPGYGGKMRTRMTLPLDFDAIRNRTDFDPINEFVVSNFARNMELIAASAETVGAQTIWALQPMVYFNPPLADNTKNLYWHDVNFITQGYLRISDRLTDKARTIKNATFVDLSGSMGDKGHTIFRDQMHITGQGYEIVSEILANEISDIVKSKLSH